MELWLPSRSRGRSFCSNYPRVARGGGSLALNSQPMEDDTRQGMRLSFRSVSRRRACLCCLCWRESESCRPRCLRVVVVVVVQVALRNIRREAVDAVKKAEKSKNLGKDQVRFTGSRHWHLGVYPTVVVAYCSVRLGWAGLRWCCVRSRFCESRLPDYNRLMILVRKPTVVLFPNEGFSIFLTRTDRERHLHL